MGLPRQGSGTEKVLEGHFRARQSVTSGAGGPHQGKVNSKRAGSLERRRAAPPCGGTALGPPHRHSPGCLGREETRHPRATIYRADGGDAAIEAEEGLMTEQRYSEDQARRAAKRIVLSTLVVG
jgi:hypothetical protein